MKKITLFAFVLVSLLSIDVFSQLNLKVQVEEIKVINPVDCDPTDDSDFLFEFKVTDNSSFAYSNNSPVAGSIGSCNYAVVNETNGPFVIIPSIPGSAIFNPANGVFFDRNYTCKQDVPSVLTVQWRGYENDDASSPSTTPVANGTTSINTHTIGIVMQAPYVQSFYYTSTSPDGTCDQTYEIKISALVSYGANVPLFIDHTHENVICTGASNGEVEGHPLGGTGTVLYDWSNDGLGDYNDPLLISGLTAGTYTFVAKDALNCTDTLEATVVEVDPPTDLSSFATSTSTVCTDQNNVLYSVATQTTPANYVWSYSGTGVTTYSATNTFSVNYSNIATGGTVSVYAQNGCSVTPTLTMDVTVIQTPTITILGNTTMCDNTQEILTASGASNFLWSTSATSSSISVSPTITTVYSVTETSSSCNASQQFTMTVLQSPTVQINGTSGIVCPSQTLAITASGNGNLYIWSDGFIGATHTISSVSTTIYTVTNTYTNSCFAQATYTLDITQGPSISITGSTLSCKSQPVTLTASGADNYFWSGGETTASITYTPAGAQTFTVLGTNTLTSCQSSTTVSVDNFPTGLISITGNTLVCDYTPQVYIATGANFYIWNNGVTSNINNLIPTSSRTISVKGTNINGCQDSTSAFIQVIKAHILSITGPDTICNGQQITLNVNSTGATSYSWNSGATGSSINVSPTTTYSYVVTSTNGICSDIKGHEIVVKSSPVINFIIQQTPCSSDAAFSLNATPTGGLYSGTGISGNMFNPSVGAGTYPITYQVTGSNSCTSSSIQNVVVSACVGLNELENENVINVYPNPFSSAVMINSTKLIKSIMLYDFTGRLVKTVLVNLFSESINLEGFSNGIYTLTIQTDTNTLQNIKIIKN